MVRMELDAKASNFYTQIDSVLQDIERWRAQFYQLTDKKKSLVSLHYIFFLSFFLSFFLPTWQVTFHLYVIISRTSS